MASIITYAGDGKTKTFCFGFSFFQPADIVVEINGQPTTIQYALQINRPNPTADMPYYGGAVCFASAPAAGDEIKIYREIVLSRPVDYQPTSAPQSFEMNQDSNFHLENIRDLRHHQKTTDNVLTEHGAKIDYILKYMPQSGATSSETPGQITPAQPAVDLSEIEGKITALQSGIAELTSQLETRALQSDVTQIQSEITNLGDQIANIPTTTLPDDADYVVASQMPTAENNYTWFRKYASGWVEQGGQATTNSGNATPVTLPVTMASSSYMPFTQGRTATDGYSGAQWHIMPVNTTKSKQTASKFYAQGSITGYNLGFVWLVHGMAAQ